VSVQIGSVPQRAAHLPPALPAMQATGTSLRIGDKPQLAGGPDKKPEEFVKSARYVSDDQVCCHSTRAHSLTVSAWVDVGLLEQRSLGM
jgi:hypothetical protein